MLTHLLRSMRESGESGWLGTGEDHTAGSVMELAEEHLARTIAAQGGIGLASMVVQGLEKPAGRPSEPAGTTMPSEHTGAPRSSAAALAAPHH